LGVFCGADFAERLLYCECCAGAGTSREDLPRRAALLMPGDATTTTAYRVGGDGAVCRRGRVPTWSLGGGRRPVAICDRGRLLCKCAHGGWLEASAACARGEACSPDVDPEGSMREGARVRAATDLHYLPDGEAPDSPAVQAAPADAAWTVPAGSQGRLVQATPRLATWDGFEQLGAAAVFAGQVAAVDEKGAARPCASGGPAPRFSIGEARCEDMDEARCSSAHSGFGANWSLCELRTGGAKTCPATVAVEAYPREQAERWLRWSREWTWHPGSASEAAGASAASAVQELLEGDVQRERSSREGPEGGAR